MSIDGTSPETTEVLLDRLRKAIIECDREKARTAAQEAIGAGLDPAMVVDQTLGSAAEVVRQKFESGEYALPHLVLSADAMTAASEVLEAALPQTRLTAKKIVVIGTVAGDLHTIGKTIVAMFLRASGFEVHDLGVDVKTRTFVSRARELQADIIAQSSLLTTTMPYQRELIEMLKSMGLRDRFKIMVGGGPVTRTWAEEIGADGYGADATEALQVARTLVGLPSES